MERLTSTDVCKAFSDYYAMPHDWREKRREAAQRAVATYEEMAERVIHSLEDLRQAMEGLKDNIYDNMADPEYTTRIDIDINEATEWVKRLQGDVRAGKHTEEDKL